MPMPNLSLDELVKLSPDRSDFLSQVPAHLQHPGRLAAQLGCDQLCVTQWACLAKDALATYASLDNVAEGKSMVESVQQDGPRWNAAAEAYQVKWGVAPCLAELVKACMTT